MQNTAPSGTTTTTGARLPRQRVSMMSRTFYLEIVGRDVLETCAPGVTIKESGEQQYALDHITREAIPVKDATHLLLSQDQSATTTAVTAEKEEKAVVVPAPPSTSDEEVAQLRADLEEKSRQLESERKQSKVLESQLATEMRRMNTLRVTLGMPEAVAVTPPTPYMGREDISSHEPSVAPPVAHAPRSVVFEETSQNPRSTTTMPRSVSPLISEGFSFGGVGNNTVPTNSMPPPSMSPAPSASIPMSENRVVDRSQAQPRPEVEVGSSSSSPMYLPPPVPPGADWTIRHTAASEGAFPHPDLIENMTIPPPPFGQRLYYCHRTRVFIIPGKIKEYIQEEVIPTLRGTLTINPTHFRLLLRRKGFLPSFMSLKVVSPEDRIRPFPLFYKCFDEVIPWCPFCMEEVQASEACRHLKLPRHIEARRQKGLEGEEPRDPIPDDLKNNWGQTRAEERHIHRRNRSPSPHTGQQRERSHTPQKSGVGGGKGGGFGSGRNFRN